MPTEGHPLKSAVDTFIQTKKVENIIPSLLGKYRREMTRLQEFCERLTVFTVDRLTAEIIIGYAAGWATQYASSTTRYRCARASCRF